MVWMIHKRRSKLETRWLSGYLLPSDFDIKLDGLVWKALLVASGHTTDAPSTIMYSSVVSRKSLHISFLTVALNQLDVMSVNISNAT
eukprot:1352422-Ditylum_brightwellii.AAC.1